MTECLQKSCILKVKKGGKNSLYVTLPLFLKALYDLDGEDWIEVELRRIIKKEGIAKNEERN